MDRSIPFPRSIDAPRIGVRVAGVVAFAALTALGAKIALPLPFTPVPITLQTFFVVLAGGWLGARDGALSQVAYLAAGVAGAPVFAGPLAGPAYLAGPTGGFLLAFPVAAWLVGSLAGRGDGIGRVVLAIVAAKVAIFALGAAWLARVMGVDGARALELAVLPFLPGAALKAAAAAAAIARGPRAR